VFKVDRIAEVLGRAVEGLLHRRRANVVLPATV
jgi:hypothetical protein